MQDRLTTSSLLVALSLIAAASAPGQVMDVPTAVQADGDGLAAYTVHMTYPESGAYFGGYTITAVENIAEGELHVDGFCMQWMEGGAEAEWTVEVTLADPTAHGFVDFHWFGCDPGFGVTERTLILGPDVAADAETWSAVKRMFR